MPLTKSDLTQALKQQKKEIIVELGKFLEKHILEPIFDLKKDVGGLKKDVGVLKKDMREVKHGLEQVHRKIDASLSYTDRHTKQLEGHEERLGQLEHASL